MPGSQTAFLTCPVWEVCSTGTRGTGKSESLIMDFVQDVGKGFGMDWRGIIFRRTYDELNDLVNRTKKLFKGNAICPDATYNSNTHTWSWLTGEELLLRYADTERDYWHYHGWEIPWLAFEELVSWPDPSLYMMLRSINRSSRKGIPIKLRSTTNPYGPGRAWVKARFIDPAPPGQIILDELGLQRVRIRGHWSENIALLSAQPDYPLTLASDVDPARRAAWLEENWDIIAGGMFDDVWDNKVHVIEPFRIPSSWYINRSFDWGFSRPFSVGWWAESNGEHCQRANGDIEYFPPGTLFRIDEWYGCNGKPNVGLGLEPPEVADGIREREREMDYDVMPGPADPSIWNQDGRQSVASMMAEKGVFWEAANANPGTRKVGWLNIRHRLKAAKLRAQGRMESENSPGLYFFENCRDAIRTFPGAPRSQKNPDDVDTDCEDHALDETRYRCLNTALMIEAA